MTTEAHCPTCHCGYPDPKDAEIRRLEARVTDLGWTLFKRDAELGLSRDTISRLQAERDAMGKMVERLLWIATDIGNDMYEGYQEPSGLTEIRAAWLAGGAPKGEQA